MAQGAKRRTRPGRSRSEPDPSTRDRILDVALEAFSQLGFEGASTRAIASGAGVNQGLIPYYFGTKEVLWREAVDRAFGLLRHELADMLKGTEAVDGRERLALMVRRYVAFVAKHPEFVRLMNEEGKRSGPRMRWLTDHHVRPLYDALQHTLDEAGVTERIPRHIHRVHLNYIFVGSVATIFHQAHECKRLAGYDPSTDEAVQAHADALVLLLLGDASLARDRA